MNKFLEAIEIERERTSSTGKPLYDIGYINGLTMAEIIAVQTDAVPVVRCENCKFWRFNPERDKESRCILFYGVLGKPFPTRPGSFCSYGEEIKDE